MKAMLNSIHFILHLSYFILSVAPRCARELFELGERRAFVNASLRETRRLAQVIGEAADEERSRRVRKDERAARVAPLARDDFADGARVRFGVASAQGSERHTLEAELSRRDIEDAHRAKGDFGDLRRVGERDLVKAVAPVYDPRALRAERGERVRE